MRKIKIIGNVWQMINDTFIHEKCHKFFEFFNFQSNILEKCLLYDICEPLRIIFANRMMFSQMMPNVYFDWFQKKLGFQSIQGNTQGYLFFFFLCFFFIKIFAIKLFFV